MPRSKKTAVSDFYCTQCGERGIPIARTNKMREPGHLKKLYCLYCGKQTNFVEIRPFGKYDYSDFIIEFSERNFTEDGQRVVSSYKQFESFVREGIWNKETQTIEKEKK